MSDHWNGSPESAFGRWREVIVLMPGKLIRGGLVIDGNRGLTETKIVEYQIIEGQFTNAFIERRFHD